MYHASTVLTGSEMPALTSIGSCAVAGLEPTRTSARIATQTRTLRAQIFVGIVTPLAVLVTLRQPRRLKIHGTTGQIPRCDRRRRSAAARPTRSLGAPPSR